MTPVGVFFIYPNEDKLGFVNSAGQSRIFRGSFFPLTFAVVDRI